MQLKGTSKNGSGTTKTKRDLQFKLRVIQLKENEGKSAKESLELACKETGLPLTQGMVDHPHSFLNMYKVSVAKSLSKGNKVVEAAVIEAGLAQDDPAEAPKVVVTEDAAEEDEGEELVVEDDAE